MLAHILLLHAAVAPAVAKLLQLRFLTIAALPALALLLTGCLPTPLVGPDPSDPGARTPPVGYRSTIGPYRSQRPVSPAPWGEQNERVTPQPKSSQ